MADFAEKVLTTRSRAWCESLCEKLGLEGIFEPTDFKNLKRRVIENRLARRREFSLGEVIDALEMHRALGGDVYSGPRARSRSRHARHLAEPQ